MSLRSDPYPAVLFLLDEQDQGYDLGARYRIEQLDGGIYALRSRAGVDRFVFEHNFHLIDMHELETLRRENGITKES